nr:hypothetical protein 15 [Candidatus Tectomicrobia bacterium]
MFTPEVRKALYALLTAVLGVFAAFNVISADQASQYADAVTQIVGALTLALATYHTHPGAAAGRHAAGDGNATEDKVA